MSYNIKNLEETKDNYVNRNLIYNGNYEVGLFMIQTIDAIKELQKQLAKKKDAIDVNDIKEVKRINE